MKIVVFSELVDIIRKGRPNEPILLHVSPPLDEAQTIASLVEQAGITPYFPKRRPQFSPHHETIYRRMQSIAMLG